MEISKISFPFIIFLTTIFWSVSFSNGAAIKPTSALIVAQFHRVQNGTSNQFHLRQKRSYCSSRPAREWKHSKCESNCDCENGRYCSEHGYCHYEDNTNNSPYAGTYRRHDGKHVNHEASVFGLNRRDNPSNSVRYLFANAGHTDSASNTDELKNRHVETGVMKFTSSDVDANALTVGAEVGDSALMGRANLFGINYRAGPIETNAGVGFDTGFRVQDNNFEVKVLGNGGSIGKEGVNGCLFGFCLGFKWNMFG